MDKRENSAVLLRISEVSEMIGMCRSKVYRMCASGEIPSVKIGSKSVRVPADDLQKWTDAIRKPGYREGVNDPPQVV